MYRNVSKCIEMYRKVSVDKPVFRYISIHFDTCIEMYRKVSKNVSRCIEMYRNVSDCIWAHRLFCGCWFAFSFLFCFRFFVYFVQPFRLGLLDFKLADLLIFILLVLLGIISLISFLGFSLCCYRLMTHPDYSK